ncbi:MAG TPA: PSD1 and planctomycete cytochrome C domain-containing protein [Gemmataceae bacterium]|nr:PSD1 and planctomycete cytochrome C domain-containing protein [Gemmataceae bacterium]
MTNLLPLLAIAVAAPPDAGGVEFFERNVRPVLVEHCYQCHSAEAKKVRGGLLLDTRPGWQKGGDTGPALVPGDTERSLLIKAIRYGDEALKMPPTGKLSDKQIAALVEWVKLGAPDPRDASSGRDGRRSASRTIDIDAAKQAWAFRPLKPTTPPPTDDPWPRTPIDPFILAKLTADGIRPNPIADRRTLIRRASFDLVGLPPTPEEVERFVDDPDPDAYSKLIDGLLDSPHFGERWARHWLDLARFGESHGYEQDYDRPFAYHYRDFVIKAFNRDLPYDTFVRWQIAGDEIEPKNHLAMMATGFLAAGTHATQITANQAEKERYDELDDMARTIGTTMLGLTVGCARCHDHKFDPIPTADYYGLLATFATTVRSDYEMDLDPEGFRKAKAKYDAEHTPLVEKLAAFERDELPDRFDGWLGAGHLDAPKGAKVTPPVGKLLAELKADPAKELTLSERTELSKWHRTIDPEWKKLNAAVEAHAKSAPEKPKVLICSEGVPAVRLHTQGLDFYDPVYHLKRGDPNQKTEVARQGFLQVLTNGSADQWRATPPGGSKLSFRRNALAEWLIDVDHGAGHLLARVIVNRLWYYHTGRGIVATPSDFGAQGEKPTHPELLDWLAGELIRNGWRLKPIHKLILTSSVYMQSGATDEARAAKDRENALFWRHPARRLEAEVIRDAMLAVSGALDPTMFGPGTLDPQQKRRSIYFFVKRSKLVPMMAIFDAPDSLQDIATRPTTTVAPQALLLLNNPAVRGYATKFAERVKGEPAAAVAKAYRLALGRTPTDAETADAIAFLSGQADVYRSAEKPDPAELALADFCHALLCLNEFVYID